HPAKAGEVRYCASIPTHSGSKEIWLEDAAPFVLVEGKSGKERVYAFDPADFAPQDIIRPKSRTFIPSRVSDNPYLMETDYMLTLQSLPEPLRSQMLHGDFNAGVQDDPWQVIPTAWVEAAQGRWRRPDRLEAMSSMGVDVARGGADSTIIARRHGMWFDVPLVYAGAQTPDGPATAGLTIAARRNNAVVHIDVIGVGSSPYDFLQQTGIHVLGINVAESAGGMDKSGRLAFRNLRSELWWRMREALDPVNNSGIALPPDRQLLADLCAPTWSLVGANIAVASREEIVKKLGRSPDYGSAYILALIDTPKVSEAPGYYRQAGGVAEEYDPYG
ncbi:MAG: terminase, partial [Saezia sp.]